MILAELLDNNNALVATSLELIEESLKEPNVDAMVKDAVKAQEAHELTKGMFIAVKTLMFAMRETYGFPTLCNFLYSDAEELALKGGDVSIDYKVVNLLTSMEEEGGSFYLQVHSLPKPVQTITCLIKMFKRLSFLYYQESPEFDALKALPYLRKELYKYSREKNQRLKEQDQLIAVMRAERLSIEDALHLMEVLAPHFLIDITEDGERIPHLNEKAFQLPEVRNAINVAHQVELLKGLCLITCVFLSRYLLEAGPSITPILETRRKEIEAESSELDPDEDDLEIQTNAMELLACVAKLDEESFYQQAYAVDDIESVIISLSTSLYRTSRYVANQDVVALASDFRNLLK